VGALRAGAARVVITPPLGTSLAGSFHDRFAEAVEDDLYAHALILEQGETRVALVSCDVICMPADIAGPARQLVAQATGIPADHVLVAGTHTHTGPRVYKSSLAPRPEDYVAALPAKIATAVEHAAARLEPAAVASGTAQEAGVSFNRRYWMRGGTVRMNPGFENPDVVRPAGPIDPEIGVIWLVRPEGSPIAAVVSFALHYVGAASGQHISPDYFGRVSRKLQARYGDDFVTVFFNGASGDVNGVDFFKPRRPPVEHAESVATAVADAVQRAIAGSTPDPAAALGSVSTRLPFRRKPITPDDVAVARAIRAAPESPPPSPYAPGPFSWVVGEPLRRDLWNAYAGEVLLLADTPEELETEVQAVRIGGTAVVALPGEIFCALGLAVKARSPLRPVLIAELANDYVGYVPTRRAQVEEGGYETWLACSALPAAGTGEAMVDAAVGLLETLRRTPGP
jgi:hypothetical protein